MQSHQIHATDAAFQNDRLQLPDLNWRSASLPPLSDKSYLFRLALEGQLTDDHRTFIASFSMLRDDLSQWRGYGALGFGFALGVRESALQAICDDISSRYGRNAVLVTCDYDGSSSAVIERLNKLVSDYQTELDNDRAHDGTTSQHMAGVIVADIARDAVALKHKFFRAEQERRLVIPQGRLVHSVLSSDEVTVVRPGKSAPYRAVEPRWDWSTDVPGPDTSLVEVVMGPANHRTIDAVELVVRTLLQDNNWSSDVLVTPSCGPFGT